MKRSNYLIDTAIWVDLFKGSDLARRVILPLMEEGRVFTCGAVLHELMVGVKKPEQREELLSTVDSLNYLEMEKADWLRSAEMVRELRVKGIVLPLTDLLVASLAESHQCDVLTRDVHFAHIQRVRSVGLQEISY
ncbi:MAG: PIN domain-containing protein [Chloroflexi bacterium]|nr:PIN domain-containing protein [Chloroflexota bacterium]